VVSPLLLLVSTPCRFLLLLVVVVSPFLIVSPLLLLLLLVLPLLLLISPLLLPGSPLRLLVVSYSSLSLSRPSSSSCRSSSSSSRRSSSSSSRPSTSLSFPAPHCCRFLLLLVVVVSCSSLAPTPSPHLASRRRRCLSSSPSPHLATPPPRLPLLFVYFPSVAVVGMVVEVVVEVVVALSSLRRWMRLCRCWVARSPSLSCGGCGGGDCRGYGVRKVQGGWKKDRGAKTNHDKRRGSWFATHHVGHPTSWVPALSSSLPGSTIE
jgi:hypothetical protein